MDNENFFELTRRVDSVAAEMRVKDAKDEALRADVTAKRDTLQVDLTAKHDALRADVTASLAENARIIAEFRAENAKAMAEQTKYIVAMTLASVGVAATLLGLLMTALVVLTRDGNGASPPSSPIAIYTHALPPAQAAEGTSSATEAKQQTE